MTDAFKDVESRDPTRIGLTEREELRRQRRWHAEWSSAGENAGPLITQLRHRAQSAARAARLMLFGLVLIGLFGTAWFLNDVFGIFIEDSDRVVREERVRIAEKAEDDLKLELTKLDARLKTERGAIETAITTEFIPALSRPDVTATLIDIRFGPEGEAVIVGRVGTILTRASKDAAWEIASRPDVTAALTDIRFGPEGEAVIVGWEGTILTRASKDAAWEIASRPDVTATLLDIRFGPEGEAVIVGDGGTILTRASTDAAWEIASHPDVTATLIDIRFGPEGEAVIVGWEGTILTRASKDAAWEIASRPDVTADLIGISFGPEGEAVIVGREGTILTRASKDAAWEIASRPDVTADLFDIRFGPEGEAVIVGGGGTILTRASKDAAWEIASRPDVTTLLTDIRFGPEGEAVIVGGTPTVFGGDGGTILTRASTDAAWEIASRPDVTAALTDIRFGPEGEAVVVGRGGTILTRAADTSALAEAQTETDLIVALSALGAYQDKPIRTERLRALQSERAGIDAQIAAVQQEKDAAEKGLLTSQQKLDEMTGFLDKCLGEAAERKADAIAACEAAYSRATEDSAVEFYKYLTTRITPAALVLFLLATLGGAYRYNVRLAAHLNARADALEAQTVVPDREKMRVLTEAFGAEGLQFKEARLPVDAVTDVVKSTVSKLSPK